MDQIQTEELRQINKQLSRLNSLRYTFLRGIALGVGTAIGTTIIFGVLIAWATRVINQIEELPVINEIESIN